MFLDCTLLYNARSSLLSMSFSRFGFTSQGNSLQDTVLDSPNHLNSTRSKAQGISNNTLPRV